PLGTRIADRTLIVLAATSVAGAVAIGIGGAIAREPWLLVFVGAGAFIVVAYNLELFGGRFHGHGWFALAWGGFPLLTGYFAVAGRIRPEAVVAAVFATLLSLAQRLLSTQVRTVRRRAASVSGTIVYRDGRAEPLDAASLTRAPEAALKALAGAVGLTAAAAVEAGLTRVRQSLARVRRIDEETSRAERQLRELVRVEAEGHAAELERVLARARAESTSLLLEEERRIAETRRKE